MENNSEKFGFNQNNFFTSGFLGFQEGSGDLSSTPCPTVPQNNTSQNSFFMSKSLENHGFHAGFGDLTITPFHESQNEPFMRGSHGIPTRCEDLTITHPTAKKITWDQQNNVGGNDTHISHARFDGITFTSPPSGQNSAPLIPGTFGIWGGINHNESSYDNFNNHGNTANTLRDLSRPVNKVNQSRVSRKCMKRIRFRFISWTKEEENVMDREILKCTFLPIRDIFKKIAALLPTKSIRDVSMRIQSLIKHGKLDDVWNWVEPSPGEGWSEFKFFIPDNPNDPDLLAIQNRFHPRANKRSRV